MLFQMKVISVSFYNIITKVLACYRQMIPVVTQGSKETYCKCKTAEETEVHCGLSLL